MNYYDLLDFKNQKVVDEIYQRVKTEEENIELDKVYNEIKGRNDTTIENYLSIYRRIVDLVSSCIGLIGSFLFIPLFIITGSFLLSSFSLIFVYMSGESLNGLTQLLTDLGVNIYKTLFSSASSIVTDIFNSNFDIFFVLGLTAVLSVIFLILFIISLFKKEKKEFKELTVQQSQYYLKVSDDDTWDYIKSSLLRRLSKRRNRYFFESYYRSYICLFNHYQKVEGTINDLNSKQKVILYIRTFMNAVNNIFGTLTKPIYYTLSIILVYYKFGAGIELLTQIENPIQTYLIQWHQFLEKCDSIISVTPLSYISGIFNGDTQLTYAPHSLITNIINNNGIEVKLYVSFALLCSVIYVIYAMYSKKIREIIRQYHRRLNFYLKKNQAIYDENKKLPKEYLYTIEFTLFIFIILIYIGLTYLEISQPMTVATYFLFNLL